MNSKMEIKEAEELKEFISDWSTRDIGGVKFDENFQLDGTPLSWFYRPILYSSLLPPPFPTVSVLLQALKAEEQGKKQKNTFLKPLSFFFQKYILLGDYAKRTIIRIKKMEKNLSVKEKILFLTFTNHLNKDNRDLFRTNKIVEKVKNDSKYEPFLLVVDPLTSFSLKKILHSEHNLYQYLSSRIRKKAREEAVSLAAKWKEISEENKHKILQYQGKDLFSLLQATLDFLYSVEFIQAIGTYYLAFREIIVREKVRAIVLSSQNNIFEKCFMAAAKKQCIPVFVVQHGIALGTLPTLNPFSNVFFSVFSERYKEELMRRNVNSSQIVVTGPVIFDGIEKFTGEKKVKELGPQLLLATSPMVEDRIMKKEEYFRKVKIILQQLKKVNPQKVIIKLHPREKYVKEYQKLLQELELKGNISQVVERAQHYQLIKDCDLLLSYGSTVAIEAMIIQRPTLSLEMFDGVNPLHCIVIKSGASPVVRYNEDIATTIQSLLKEDLPRTLVDKFVQEFCFKVDGKASARITEFIYEKIKEF